jgi:pimeloyl-ACP methyl ester carboxylesterase
MGISLHRPHCPEWVAYLKQRQPKTLIVWGKNDPIIWPAAAEAMKQAVPKAELHYFDSSHFALDENVNAIAEAIIKRFAR